MSETYEEGRQILEALSEELKSLDIAKFNEADTRFHFIDTILTKCLGWEPKDINNEDVVDEHYADYKLNLFRPVAVWEAKRTGNYFELPAGKQKIIYPLKSLCKDNPEFKKALIQVSGYCHDAIIVDVSIFDKDTRGKTINTFDITQRLERSLVFKTYLDNVWNSAKFKDTHFVWPQRSKELEIDIEKIKSKNQTHRQ